MEIFINNQKYKVSKTKRWNIIHLCNSLQIKIPVFCYHEKLNVAGNCRMCLIEVEKSPKPVVACATPLMDQMSIFTDTPLVKKARENVLEFLLINHPLDCPICDQGGECDLQENTKDFASDRTRVFFYKKRAVEDKNLGTFVKTIMTRCIHCTRCVRFIEEYTNEDSLRTIGRGSHTEIGTYINKFIKNEFSGNLVDICPVGALTAKTYAFVARPWELRKTKTIDPMDSMGTSIIVSTRAASTPQNFYRKKAHNFEHDQILRILPFFNENLNENWISDKTRFSFDGNLFNRLKKPKIIYNTTMKNIKKYTNQYSWDLFFKNVTKDLIISEAQSTNNFFEQKTWFNKISF